MEPSDEKYSARRVEVEKNIIARDNRALEHETYEGRRIRRKGDV